MNGRSAGANHSLFSVMPALGAGIHVFCASSEDVDGRDKPGHDAGWWFDVNAPRLGPFSRAMGDSAAGARPAATKPTAASKAMSNVVRMSELSPMSGPLLKRRGAVRDFSSKGRSLGLRLGSPPMTGISGGVVSPNRAREALGKQAGTRID
jgi:hypothetical protein